MVSIFYKVCVVLAQPNRERKMSIPKGSTVTQVVEVITGITTKTQFNESYDQLEYLVEYINSAGENHSKWFLENQIKVVAAPVAPTPQGE